MKKIIVLNLSIVILLVFMTNIVIANNSLEDDLIEAVENGELIKVRRLIEDGANINATYTNGTTILMLAARYGYLEIVNFLIEAGADINIKSHYSVTALIWAIYGGNIEVVEALIDAKTDVNTTINIEVAGLIEEIMDGYGEIKNIKLNPTYFNDTTFT